VGLVTKYKHNVKRSNRFEASCNAAGLSVKLVLVLVIALLLPGRALAEQSCLAPEYPAGLNTPFGVEPAFPELPEMPRLVQLTQAAGDSTYWYGVSQKGTIWRFANQATTTELETVLDWSDSIESFGEAGLLGLAFHPAFATNSHAYIYYTPRAAISRLSRITLQAGRYLENSERVLIDIPQRNINHNGGGLAFGPDGYLYLSVGDGGGGSDPLKHGQNTATLLASMLRIDVDIEGESLYAIPPDNPFASNKKGRAELFAWGLRNTWRWSFDPDSGLIWGGDVGEKKYEEINIIKRGANYGWSMLEGEYCREAECGDDTLQDPYHVYPHAQGECAVIGGPVIRQSSVAELAQHYLYADFCSGKVYGLPLSKPGSERKLLAASGLRPSGFALGQAGEIYLLNLIGSQGAAVFSLQPQVRQTAELPTQLSALGCFSAMNPPTPAAGIWPYKLAQSGWNHGEDARYFASVPKGEVLLPGFKGDLVFPRGTVLIKNLHQHDALVETQLLMYHLTGWAGYSYAWNNAGTDATLILADGELIGDRRFLSRTACTVCHTKAARGALGADLAQFASVKDKQGRTQLQQLGESARLAFYGALQKQGTGPAIHPHSEGSLEARARSYLHVNCSGCHRPDGAEVGLDLRRTVSMQDSGMCQQGLGAAPSGIAYPRVQPGAAQHSLLYLRMQDEGNFHMPPLGGPPFDRDGLSLIGQWINSLDDC
jgi:mono/diheme cytochrome c family protein